MKIFTHKKPQEATAHGLTALMATERPHLLRYACYRLGNPDDAQDAVQDTFLLLHNRQQDAHGQPLFQPRHYLYRCLSNICTDRLRQHQTRQFTLWNRPSIFAMNNQMISSRNSGKSPHCWPLSQTNRPRSSASESMATTVLRTLPPFWNCQSLPSNPASNTELRKSEKASMPKVKPFNNVPS